MSLLLKLWAAVAVAFAGANHEVSQVKAQSIKNTLSCIVHPVSCAQGMYAYYVVEDRMSEKLEDGLKQSFVDIGQTWYGIKVPQEKSEL